MTVRLLFKRAVLSVLSCFQLMSFVFYYLFICDFYVVCRRGIARFDKVYLRAAVCEIWRPLAGSTVAW